VDDFRRDDTTLDSMTVNAPKVSPGVSAIRVGVDESGIFMGTINLSFEIQC